MPESTTPYRRLITFLALFLAASMVLAAVLHQPPPSVPMASLIVRPAPELQAHAYLVRVVGRGDVLLARRAGKSLAPASLTKVATALVAQEFIPSLTWIPISNEAKAAVEPRSTATPPGEEFLRDDLIRWALVHSANDAAQALAEEVGRRRGGRTFAERLERFRLVLGENTGEWRLTHTTLQNPSGLDEPGHRSTATDLAMLAEYAWFHAPELWEMTRVSGGTIRSRNGAEYAVDSTDTLLTEFPKLLGVKTGFTDEAGEALLILYPWRETEVVVVAILGSPDRSGDGRKILAWLDRT